MRDGIQQIYLASYLLCIKGKLVQMHKLCSEMAELGEKPKTSCQNLQMAMIGNFWTSQGQDQSHWSQCLMTESCFAFKNGIQTLVIGAEKALFLADTPPQNASSLEVDTWHKDDDIWMLTL